MRWIWMSCLLCVASIAEAGPVSSFDDITFWAGSGDNEAAIVIDWVEGSSTDESLVWGYRWNGTATGEDMLRAVVAADPRLFVKVDDFGGLLGTAVYGFGYDNGDGNFALNDGTVFDADGIANSPGSADGGAAVDPADIYAEGWFLGFWHYGVSLGNPYDGGSWLDSNFGASNRPLTDGDWDSWAFTSTFDFNAYAQNPHAAAVPEPATVALLIAAAPIVLLMKRRRVRAIACGLICMFGVASFASASPFATGVISYTPGVPVGVGSPAPYQTNGSQAIGSPAHDTQFGSQVGVFYPAFGSSEITTIGAGGQLTVMFDHQVQNDPNNPFGIDLLVFGNAFYVRNAQGLASGIFAEPGKISVSQDNVTWFDVPSVFGDTAFPTLGYTNTVYSGSDNKKGTILTDFTRPVDPAFNAIGKTEAQIEAGYAGSGGGTGVDLSLVGLPWIQYVRVSQPAGDTWSTEIDGFADVASVPEPAAFVLASVAAGCLAIAHRNRKRLSH